MLLRSYHRINVLRTRSTNLRSGNVAASGTITSHNACINMLDTTYWIQPYTTHREWSLTQLTCDDGSKHHCQSNTDAFIWSSSTTCSQINSMWSHFSKKSQNMDRDHIHISAWTLNNSKSNHTKYKQSTIIVTVCRQHWYTSHTFFPM